MNYESKKRIHSILNDERLLKTSDMHVNRLKEIYVGKTPAQPFYLCGVIGKSLANSAEEPEMYIRESLANLADQAECLFDSEVFRPLSIYAEIYGVHFSDKLLGAEVIKNEDSGQWYTKYLSYPVGRLEYPDLEHNPLWQASMKLVEAFLDWDVKVPVYSLPCISSALNIAVNLYGQEILVAMLNEPENAMHDLKVINDVLCSLHRWYLQKIPALNLQPSHSALRYQLNSFGFIDGCTTQLISSKMYRELIAPLDDELLSVYPNGGMIHLCGSSTQHIPAWREMKSLRVIQLNDKAAEDLEIYFRELRDDQVFYVIPYEGMPIERILGITGGRRLIIEGDPVTGIDQFL